MYRQLNGSNAKEIMLINTFRKLWEQHIMWTRSFIISTAADLGDLDLVTKRLLRNPSDFANVLQIYYGNQKADKFSELLTQHLLIGADLVNAVKAGNTEGADEARTKWYANADEIAEFLSSINPFWIKKEWQSMLYEHLRTTELEAINRLNGRFDEDIKLYDDIENQALGMADYMASGIQKQFRL